jgi:Flp pilus assembly CpaE family ATPase
MPILCEPSGEIRELMYSMGGNTRAVRNVGEAARLLDAEPGEMLVVIGPGISFEDAVEFTSTQRLIRPTLGVILIRTELDVGLMSRSLQAGAREVVGAGDYAALTAACRRSIDVTRQLLAAVPRHDHQEAVNPGRIVTVFAAKGGCGKTTIAVNLAVALARYFDQKVCIVDLDLAFGDVAISVQLDPVRTIVDALPMAGHIDTTGAARLLTRYRPNLSMLLAPVTPGDAERIPPQLVGELLSVLRSMHDFVVVDTPPQFSEHVLTAMDASAHHVLLTTPDVSALKNLRVTLDMLDLLSYPRDVRSIVINRSDSKVGLTLDDVERAVRCPASAQVPSSRAVPISINKGTPITMSTPGHPVSQAIVKFADEKLIRGAPPAPVAHRGGSRARRAR